MMKSFMEVLTPRASRPLLISPRTRRSLSKPNVSAQVEMRDGLLGFGQTGGNHLAHTVKWHSFEPATLINGFNSGCICRCWHGHGRYRSRRSRRGDSGAQVCFNDAALRAGSSDGG